MRKYIIAGNWKMNGTKESVQNLLDGIKNKLSEVNNSNIEWIVFPPFVYLDQVERSLTNTPIAFGSQNLSTEKNGAFTGEISTAMLQDFHCKYVLVGHSERRTLYGENDELVAKKFMVAQQAGLIPILCVGETLHEREQGLTQAVVMRQLNAVFKAAGNVEVFQNAVVAYEPVWAIGTGLNATPEQAQEVHAAIRKEFTEYNADLASKLQILYGGSLKADNAKSLLAMPDIDGGLIGGASLKAEEFINIGKACNQ